MEHAADRQLDASGLNCPLPILKTKKALASMAGGETIHVIATDPGAMPDFAAYAEHSGHRLHVAEQRGECFHFVLEKVG